MNADAFRDIEKLETDLWAAADNLRANSKLTSSDYFMPVLGVIFLRHAANRFDAAHRQIEADQTSGKMPKRKVLPADYIARRSLYLPDKARYDWIMQQAATSGADLPKLVTDAMTAIEAEFEPLLGVLPKDYGIFETKVLEDLMRLFNSEQIKQATGDVFGRIYEYFLAKFSIQKAHDNGEFFTPSSIVQTTVNVIEPDHGTVFDPACGSGGMFVQSSHFIEHEGGDTAKKVVFYGQEKNRDTIRIAKMNLAVHGLEGKIAEAITYYQDDHNLGPKKALEPGRCDFVMANPPFNVDLVDAEHIKGDPRLPFGVPGVNKQKKVGNGNYLWISYFWRYLSAKGRAGFVMSSQASSAGHGEKEVRQKIVETGDVDVMISIRSNFFYTRTVPCELWHFDRAKPPERRDKVLMLDARNVYRKVTRKIYDFSPEQMLNLAGIVWLYRGQRERFLGLVKDYLGRVCAESAGVHGNLAPFAATLADLRGRFDALTKAAAKHADIDTGKKQALADAVSELREAATLYEADAKKLLAGLAAFGQKYAKALPDKNDAQHTARKGFDPSAETIRGLVKQVDLLYKLAARVADLGAELAGDDAISTAYEHRATRRLVKQLDEERKAAVEQLKHAAYFHRQLAWLQGRFPKAELEAVPGLVKLVDRKEIEAADWSLTPRSIRWRCPARGGRGLRLRADLARHPHRAGRPQQGGGRAGGEDSGELRGVGSMNLAPKRIAQLGRVVTGKTPPTSRQEYFGGDYPFVTPTDLEYDHYYCRMTERTVTAEAKTALPNQFIPADAVMFTCIGATIGKCAIAPAECLTNQQINSVVANEHTDSKFLYYLLCHNVDVVKGLGGGAATPIVSKSKFEDVEFLVPPFRDQQAVSAILSAYDDLIENNRRRMALLEETARHLYREWFVRLRFPGHEHTCITNGLPQGWAKSTLSFICVPDIGIQTGPFGSQLHQAEYADTGVPVVMPKDMINLRIDTSSIARVPEEVAERLSRHRMQEGDVAYGRRGDIGRRAFIGKRQTGWLCGTGSLRLRPDPHRISARYFFDALGSPETFGTIAGRAKGATLPNLNATVMESVPMLVPPRTLQDIYTETVQPMADQVEILSEQNEKLRAARDLLLPRLMSGEIAV